MKIVKIYYKVHNYMTLKRQSAKYLSYPNIRGKIYIRNLGKLSFGTDVVINSGVFPNPVGGSLITSLSIDPNAVLQIGNSVGISNAEIVVKKSVIIGDNVLIGGGVKIYDSDFHPLSYEKRMREKNDGKSLGVIIKNGAFIGAHSIILKGVTIGERSIIGAGSVVTKDVPDREIWAGNPARLIRRSEDENIMVD